MKVSWITLFVNIQMSWSMMNSQTISDLTLDRCLFFNRGL